MDPATVQGWCHWTADQVVRVDGLVRDYWVLISAVVGLVIVVRMVTSTLILSAPAPQKHFFFVFVSRNR
jgi:hypothetical protein